MTVDSEMFRGAVVAWLAAGSLACQSPAPEPKPEAGTRAPASAAATPTPAIDKSAPTLEELRNATYQGIEEAGGPFTLANGKWEGKPFEPGGASMPSVVFAGDFRLARDLDGDGFEEAVALLEAGTGGSKNAASCSISSRPVRTTPRAARASL